MTTPNDADRDFGSSDCSSARRDFEQFAKASPFCLSVERYDLDHAWSGCYVDLKVDAMWHAWKKSFEKYSSCTCRLSDKRYHGGTWQG